MATLEGKIKFLDTCGYLFFFSRPRVLNRSQNILDSIKRNTLSISDFLYTHLTYTVLIQYRPISFFDVFLFLKSLRSKGIGVIEVNVDVKFLCSFQELSQPVLEL